METSSQICTEFLPISRADMEARGWDQLDFVVVGGDAYVDHPSFGTAIISRLLEAEGYKVGVLAQPRYTDCEDFKRFGKPKYGFFIGGGNVDSMVSHYSVAKIPRAEDEYSPGGKGGARPDRSATVYTRLAKQAYPDLPVILGGLEASLRRFAHYDYWLDTVLPSIAEDSGADIISFGMGEHQTVEIARRLAAGEPVESLDYFRENDMEVTYGRIACLKENGRDRSRVQSTYGWNNIYLPINSREAEMVDELAPLPDEIVVNKTTDSVSLGTNYTQLLHNMGIDTVVVTGIVTDQCVASSVRVLADQGFQIICVEDCCAAPDMELHDMELKIMNILYCNVLSTDETLEVLKTAK